FARHRLVRRIAIHRIRPPIRGRPRVTGVAIPPVHRGLGDCLQRIERLDLHADDQLALLLDGVIDEYIADPAAAQGLDVLAGDGEADPGALDDGDGAPDDVAALIDDRPAGVAGVHAAGNLDGVEGAVLVMAQARDVGRADGDVLAKILAEGIAEYVDFRRLI